MSLRLRAVHTEQVHTHLCKAYPEEGCGVLVGRDEGERRIVEQVIPLDNRREDARSTRYLIPPEQLLHVERAARDAGLDVLGFFHSHPDHPARPSAFDLEHAWPYYSYLIVSVVQGRAVKAASWRLVPDRTRFEPEPIEPAPAAASP